MQLAKSCYSTLQASGITIPYEVQWSCITLAVITLLLIGSYSSLSYLFSPSVKETKPIILILLVVVTTWWHVLWWWEIKTPFFPSLGDDCWLVLSWLSFSTYLQCFPLRISLLLMSLKVCDKLTVTRIEKKVLMFLFLSRYNLSGNFCNQWVCMTSVKVTLCTRIAIWFSIPVCL